MAGVVPREEASLPITSDGHHDYLEAALMLLSIIGLALLPTHGASKPQSDLNGVELRGQRVVEESGTSQAQENESHRSDPEVLLVTSSEKQAPAAGSHAPTFSTSIFVVNFVLWIILAIAFNAYSKTYLRDSHNPVGLVVLQGATGVIVLCVLGGIGMLDLRSGTKLSVSAARGVGLASLFHALQVLLTNFAVFVGGVAVTNALKAIEPVAAAVFSYFLLGKKSVTPPRGTALAVIIAGILTLTYKGNGGSSGSSGGNRVLLSAVFTAGAVCSNAMRNVMIKKGDPIPPHQTLMTCSAAALVVGVGLMLLRLVARGIDDLLGQGCGGEARTTPFGDGSGSWIKMDGVKAALCYVGFQLASFNLLAFLSPIGHAVGNSCKRTLVFGSGILLLGESMSARQLSGALVALVGVLAYGLAGALGDSPRRVASPPTTAEPPTGSANRYTLGWCLRVCGVRRLLCCRYCQA